MAHPTVPPKVFVSYCRTSPQHEEWVRNLAGRLMSDGVDVILDSWDLRVGQDKYVFMEKVVTDPTVRKVLVILDKRYKEKADQRIGGVGAEAQMIVEDVYETTGQTKILPIVRERDENGKPCLPLYLRNRMFIDFTCDDRFDGEYEGLLRSIFEQPAFRKPPLGSPPDYLFEEEHRASRIPERLSAFQDSVMRASETSGTILSEYLGSLLEALEDCRIELDLKGSPIPFEQKLVDSVEKFIPYRDEFVQLVQFLAVNARDSKYYEQIIATFQETIRFMFPPADAREYSPYWCDNYRFVLYELFLYSISILIAHKKFVEADLLLTDDYYSRATSKAFSSYIIFNQAISSLDGQRTQRLKRTKLPLVAELIRDRANIPGIPFEDLMQADLTLCVRSALARNDHRNIDSLWFPRTLACIGKRAEPFNLYLRARSGRHFEGVKTLLAVKNREDLLARFEKAKFAYGLDTWHFNYRRIDFSLLLNLTHIGTR